MLTRCNLINPEFDVIQLNLPDKDLPPYHRRVVWKARALFDSFQVEVEANDMSSNRIDSRFSYTVQVPGTRFDLPLDAGFNFKVYVQPMISSCVVGSRKLVFECAGRQLPQAFMTDAEEADTRARLRAPLADGVLPMNILVLGRVGTGKSDLINRILQAIRGINTTVAASSRITGSLTRALICHAVSPSLKLFDYRGYLVDNNADADFAAFRETIRFILQGAVAPHIYANGVFTQGQVDADSNRIHGVIFVDKLESIEGIEGAYAKREVIMTLLAEVGIPHVVVKTHVDGCSVGRLRQVNLASTPEDSFRLSELAPELSNHSFLVAQYVKSVDSPENQQHRRLVLRAVRSLMLNIDIVRGM